MCRSADSGGPDKFLPSQHPLTEMLRYTKDSSLLPIAAYAAMVAAPIFEETFFRLFLQGWLEKLQVTAARARIGLGTKEETDAVLFGGETPASLMLEFDDDGNPFRHPPGNGSSTPGGTPKHKEQSEGDDTTEDESAELESIEERPVMWMPILVSSGLFALAHVMHGPDWVPLFLLALGLGYIYQRTRRVLPCIVVHVLINSVGILQLWSHVRQ